jgi:hypothetical protein
MMRWNEHFLEPSFGGVCKILLHSIDLQTVEIKIFFICPFVSAKGRKPSAQTMAHALFENTRNPGKKVDATAYESKRPMGRFCRISKCFQIHRLHGTAFGRAHALR